MKGYEDVPAFRGLNETQVRNLISSAERREFEPGMVLRDPDGVHDMVMVLLEGEARVELGGETLADIQAPAIVGEIEFLCRQFQPAKVSATTRCSTLCLSFVDLESRVDDGDSATLKFLVNVSRTLAFRLTQMNDKFVELSKRLDAGDPSLSELQAFQRKLFVEWDV